MNKPANIELSEVKALRQDFKESTSENKFKKTLLFGYDVNETNQYIEAMEANRELEKNAFLDRIKELEQIIKQAQNEKEEWEASIGTFKRSMEEYEKQINAIQMQLKEKEDLISDYEYKLTLYENKLKEREDAVILQENISLKEQLAVAVNERNEYASQCEILKSQNDFYENKTQNLENEVEKLSERLAHQMKVSRDQNGDLSLQITKIIEGNDFMSKKLTTNLEDLLYYIKNYKEEAEQMSKKIKETIAQFQQ